MKVKLERLLVAVVAAVALVPTRAQPFVGIRPAQGQSTPSTQRQMNNTIVMTPDSRGTIADGPTAMALMGEG
jgi:hypothetical protein